ncbi:hypothetical protein ZWY2020_019687 [Hordeum vulgare]|nr:hypothetical protein ZWY2020_019687 [Hordeum vulgare]
MDAAPRLSSSRPLAAPAAPHNGTQLAPTIRCPGRSPAHSPLLIPVGLHLGLKVHEDLYGQLGHRLCVVGRAYRTGFEACFVRCYAAAHRMGIDELRAAAGLFAHLLAMDVVPWHGVLGGVRITEEDTTSSSHILMKVMFQEMAEQLGVRVLGRRMNDDDNPVVRDALFPRDKAENTRSALCAGPTVGPVDLQPSDLPLPNRRIPSSPTSSTRTGKGREPEIYVVKLLVGRDNPLDGQGLKVHEDHYGQLGHRLCGVGRAYRTGFEACFVRCYAAAHRMGIDELRAAVGLFAHLLAMDVVPWHGVLGGVRITEEDTTSSSRILMKVMFQEMAKQLGVRVLGQRMNDDDNPVVRDALFPRDKAENTRFAINFFMAIGLGGVTEPARKILSL